MTSIKSTILFFGAIVFINCILLKIDTINTNRSNENKKDICTDLVDSLNEIIVDQKDQIHFLKDELQFKESEISYWGHKYDSIKTKNK